MNLVIFASDAKGLSSLNSIIQEANSLGIKLFAMITQSTQLKHPVYQQGDFQILCNVERKSVVRSETLGVDLPFKPDWLLVNRERWNPELDIIKEFKLKLNSKVGLIEPNSHILNNAETRLETYSKNRFIDLIDIFFVHSSQAKYQQQLAGFTGNMIVVGNPKYDINLDPDPKTIEQLKQFYNIDTTKKQVLLFSLVNQHRKNINIIFKNKIFRKYIEWLKRKSHLTNIIVSKFHLIKLLGIMIQKIKSLIVLLELIRLQLKHINFYAYGF